MTVRELIDLLEAQDADDAEVRLAFQPSWPLQYHIGDVALPDAGDLSSLDLYNAGTGNEQEWYLSDGDEGDVGGPYDSREAALRAMDEMAAAEREVHPPVVYIAEGGQVYDTPYLPAHVSRELGWR
jgi:hypothetical protein